MQEEYTFTCPHCWQRISVLVDLSIEEQAYVEDCEVCCRPIQFDIATDGETILRFDAYSLDE